MTHSLDPRPGWLNRTTSKFLIGCSTATASSNDVAEGGTQVEGLTGRSIGIQRPNHPGRRITRVAYSHAMRATPTRYSLPPTCWLHYRKSSAVEPARRYQTPAAVLIFACEVESRTGKENYLRRAIPSHLAYAKIAVSRSAKSCARSKNRTASSPMTFEQSVKGSTASADDPHRWVNTAGFRSGITPRHYWQKLIGQHLLGPPPPTRGGFHRRWRGTFSPAARAAEDIKAPRCNTASTPSQAEASALHI
jgi:hypothetical protein